jgi:hypothetical protein
MDKIFTRRSRGNCPQGKEQQNLLRKDHSPGMKTLLMTMIKTSLYSLCKQGQR